MINYSKFKGNLRHYTNARNMKMAVELDTFEFTMHVFPSFVLAWKSEVTFLQVVKT